MDKFFSILSLFKIIDISEVISKTFSNYLGFMVVKRDILYKLILD